MPLPLRTPTLHPFHTPLAIVSLLGMLLAASTRADDAKGEAGVTEDPSGGLHGTLATVRKPLKTFALPVTGEIRDLCITPDAKRLVLHELASKKDGSRVSRVSVMDLATDKVTLLQEWPSLWTVAAEPSISALRPKHCSPCRYKITSLTNVLTANRECHS